MFTHFTKSIPGALIFIGLFLTGPSISVKAQDPGQKFLWQIGKADDQIGEFALAPAPGRPAGEHLFVKDGVFIVGKSNTGNDWPYSHPGPNDGWAGNRQHSYSILFGIKHLEEADSKLRFRLIDVGNRNVTLNVTVNGHEFHAMLPEGAAQSIYGDADKGKKYQFDITIPAGVLKTGDNRISITNAAGSWFVYDWIGFETPPAVTGQPVRSAVSIMSIKGMPFISTHDGQEYQSACLSLVNTGGPTGVTVNIRGMAPQKFDLVSGSREITILAPEVTKDSSVAIRIDRGQQETDQAMVLIRPVAKTTIYILPHSHNDLGYTEIQTNVEKKQINNLLSGIEYARKTKDYPAGARYVWNLEGTYAADLYLQRMNDQQKKDFYESLANGGVALNGMYVNTLTGLCRPEELLQLFKFSTELAKKTKLPVDAAMISDVPGYTWGTVTAMAQAGIKYFSAAPNNFDRIGDILEKWEDKPFYWLSPSGKEKVLVWIPYRGYALSHGVAALNADFVSFYANKLQEIGYPYDISYIRWSGHGDNAVPEIIVSDFVREWNSKYTWPKFIISSTSTAFHAFEDKFGSRLPTVSGDWTGYWEDGAGSSAFETSENRTSSARLTQAETLWSMVDPGGYPAGEFKRAWQRVILYSEHTWGADESVTRPLSQKTKEQWEIKKSYADTAANLSEALLKSATAGTGAAAATGTAGTGDGGLSNAIDVFNTNSWERNSLMLVPKELSANRDLVKDGQGVIVPSQRLSTGELAFVARGVSPFAAKRFYLSARKAGKTVPGYDMPVSGNDVRVSGNSMDNGIVSVGIDETTGAIKSIRNHAIDNNFADSATGNYLNDYLFLHGNNLADLKRNRGVKISVKEQGPVLSTLLIESSDVPGCNKLTREIRLVGGFDYVEMTNILDKKPAELNPHPGDYPWANTGGKESVHFGFPFHVADGAVKIDIPMAIMRPETDQIPGSCKNWLEVGAWADVSNKDLGVTWATLDAPLVQVGGITATLLGGQTNPAVWRKTIEPTQKLYSWALNNHWETNYRAYQDGIITFRYALRPHGTFEPVAATQFATGLTQPLIVAKADGRENASPKLRLGSANIIALVLKPSEDGKAWILTLFNPSDKPQKTDLRWSSPVSSVHLSNTGEGVLDIVEGPVEIAPLDVVTLRVEK